MNQSTLQEPAENQGKTPAEQMKARIGKWLHITDPEALEIVMATAISIYLPGDPLWTLLVGPSGGGKTEMLNMFTESEDVFVVSKLTPKTLLSGSLMVPDGEDLIYTLNDKLLLIKDLAPILELGQDEQNQILSDLRDAYDGLVVRTWGSGKPAAVWKGKFGLIAAVTGAIDKKWKFAAELGERYVRINLKTDPKLQTQAALDLLGREDAMRKDLRSLGRYLLKQYNQKDGSDIPSIPEDFKKRVGDVAYTTAVLRTPVIRDHSHVVQSMPQPEVGTRLAKQFLRLAQATAWLYESDVSDRDFAFVMRAAQDAVSLRRKQILAAIRGGHSAFANIAKHVNFATSSLKIELEDLELLGVVVQDDGWKVKSEFTEFTLD